MDPVYTLLIVDDDPNIRRLLESLAEELELFRVLTAESAFDALEVLNIENVDVLMTDQMMPRMTGIELLAITHSRFPDLVHILVTAVSDITVAVDAINRGHLFAWVQKPIGEEQFWGVLRKAHARCMEREKLKREAVAAPAAARMVGPYLVERTLGEGGMGTVFRARDTREGRVVAIKVLRDVSSDAIRLQRFQREVMVSEKVRHPGVVRVLDQGWHENRPYIVTEYLEGQNLGDFLHQWDPGDLGGRCRFGVALVKILRHIHASGVVHRDLKPSNIFIENGAEEPGERIRILDFGIVKVAEVPQITQTGSLEGTLEYIAPECLAAFSEANPVSDLYALGVVFCDLFFGSSPFRGLPIAELLERKQKGDVVLPEDRGVPPELGKMIRGLMHPDPGQRLADYDLIEFVLGRFSCCDPPSRAR